MRRSIFGCGNDKFIESIINKFKNEGFVAETIIVDNTLLENKYKNVKFIKSNYKNNNFLIACWSIKE